MKSKLPALHVNKMQIKQNYPIFPLFDPNFKNPSILPSSSSKLGVPTSTSSSSSPNVQELDESEEDSDYSSESSEESDDFSSSDEEDATQEETKIENLEGSELIAAWSNVISQNEENVSAERHKLSRKRISRSDVAKRSRVKNGQTDFGVGKRKKSNSNKSDPTTVKAFRRLAEFPNECLISDVFNKN